MLFAVGHSFSAGLVVLVVFLVYTQLENHVLNPIVMSRTVKINPLLVLISILVGASIGGLVGGFFGGFVGTLLAIPVAGSIQVIVREVWHATVPEPEQSPGGVPGPGAAVAAIGAPSSTGFDHRCVRSIGESRRRRTGICDIGKGNDVATLDRWTGTGRCRREGSAESAAGLAR